MVILPKIWLNQKLYIQLHHQKTRATHLVSVDPVAQQVEHNTFNVWVPGSSPGGITEKIKQLRKKVTAFSFLQIPILRFLCKP